MQPGEWGFVSEGGNDYLVWSPADGSKRGELFYNGPAGSSEGFNELESALRGDLQWAWIADDLNNGRDDDDDIGGSWICNQNISATTAALSNTSGDPNFQPNLTKNALGGRSVITHTLHGAIEERFDVADPRSNYSFLHYYGTLVCLVKPGTDGTDNDHCFWGGNLNSPAANRGALLRWRESTEAFIWDYRTSLGGGASAVEASSSSPAGSWYLLFCETDFNDDPDACKIYQGTSLAASSPSVVSAAESGDAQQDADIGTYPSGTQWGWNSQWAFFAGYNKILTSAEKTNIVSAVNSYYGQSFS